MSENNVVNFNSNPSDLGEVVLHKFSQQGKVNDTSLATLSGMADVNVKAIPIEASRSALLTLTLGKLRDKYDELRRQLEKQSNLDSRRESNFEVEWHKKVQAFKATDCRDLAVAIQDWLYERAKLDELVSKHELTGGTVSPSIAVPNCEVVPIFDDVTGDIKLRVTIGNLHLGDKMAEVWEFGHQAVADREAARLEVLRLNEELAALQLRIKKLPADAERAAAVMTHKALMSSDAARECAGEFMQLMTQMSGITAEDLMLGSSSAPQAKVVEQ